MEQYMRGQVGEYGHWIDQKKHVGIEIPGSFSCMATPLAGSSMVEPGIRDK